jgi:tRNA dimethylallyltransferase
VDGVEALAPRLIAVVGPTASGKSAVGMALAREHAGEIVSCDSLQVYRGFDVGAAKPSLEDRREIAHHLIDVVEPEERFSAAEYARLARAAITAIHGRGRLPLVVGGTGLYLRALLQGLFEGPARDDALRARLAELVERFGIGRLHRLLSHIDRDAAARIHPHDPVRIVRALEVFFLTGRPISSHHKAAAAEAVSYDALVIGLAPSRSALRIAVERRARGMWEGGLLEEVRRLLGRPLGGALLPLGAIGYRQAVQVVRGTLSQEEAHTDLVRETMRYAKRQMTWFRRQTPVAWFDGPEAALAAARSWILSRGGAPWSREAPSS